MLSIRTSVKPIGLVNEAQSPNGPGAGPLPPQGPNVRTSAPPIVMLLAEAPLLLVNVMHTSAGWPGFRRRAASTSCVDLTALLTQGASDADVVGQAMGANPTHALRNAGEGDGAGSRLDDLGHFLSWSRKREAMATPRQAGARPTSAWGEVSRPLTESAAMA